VFTFFGFGGKFVHCACMFVVGHRNGKPKLKTNNGFFYFSKMGTPTKARESFKTRNSL